MKSASMQIVIEALESYNRRHGGDDNDVQVALQMCRESLSAQEPHRARLVAQRASEALERVNQSGMLRGAATVDASLGKRCTQIAQQSADVEYESLREASRRLVLEIVLGMDGVQRLYPNECRLRRDAQSQSDNDRGAAALITAATCGTIVFALGHAWLTRCAARRM